MAMSEGYRNAIADHGASLITHIGLVDGDGTEISGTGYARLAVHWSAASGGIVRPWANSGLDQNLEFTVPAGETVGGWRGFTQLETGGTNYGGEDLDNETFTNEGTYTLLGASSGIKHLDPE